MADPGAFISYSRQDTEFALRLARDLKSAHARVWLDQLDIDAGHEWDNAIEGALTAAPRMLLILSPASASSRNVRNEVAFALDEGKVIIPILYRDCTVPLQLRRIQRVDFRGDYAAGLRSLLRYMDVATVANEEVQDVEPQPDPQPQEESARVEELERARQHVDDDLKRREQEKNEEQERARVQLLRNVVYTLTPDEQENRRKRRQHLEWSFGAAVACGLVALGVYLWPGPKPPPAPVPVIDGKVMLPVAPVVAARTSAASADPGPKPGAAAPAVTSRQGFDSSVDWSDVFIVKGGSTSALAVPAASNSASADALYRTAEMQNRTQNCGKDKVCANVEPMMLEACRLGSGDACSALYVAFYQMLAPKTAPHDDGIVTGYFETACNRGVANDCFKAGMGWYEGYGVFFNVSKGMALWAKGCSGGEAINCYMAGEKYEYSTIAGWRDLAKARDFMSKGCAMKYKMACDELRELER